MPIFTTKNAIEYGLNRFFSEMIKVFCFLHISVSDSIIISWINFQISQVCYDSNPDVYCNFENLQMFPISLTLTNTVFKLL